MPGPHKQTADTHNNTLSWSLSICHVLYQLTIDSSGSSFRVFFSQLWIQPTVRFFSTRNFFFVSCGVFPMAFRLTVTNNGTEISTDILKEAFLSYFFQLELLPLLTEYLLFNAHQANKPSRWAWLQMAEKGVVGKAEESISQRLRRKREIFYRERESEDSASSSVKRRRGKSPSDRKQNAVSARESLFPTHATCP